MLKEHNILFNNIKNLRQIITEGVGETDIRDAIENHEWVYIYYDGDDGNKTGYRTVRPYVLGTSKAGNTVIRAWQDNPRNSVHFQNKPTRQDSKYHDYWTDSEGDKPGWRMFRLDRISKVYPIGKKFHDNNGKVMIPAGYHEGGDKDMSSIIAYVSTKSEPEYVHKHDKEQPIDTTVSRRDQQKQKWDSIRNGDKNSRKITAADVNKLRNIASNVYKKSRGSFYVVIDDKKNFQLIQIKDKDKQGVPDKAVVGTLTNLYDTLVQKTPPDNFFRDTLKKAKPTESNLEEEDNSTIPYKRMTFFK